MGIKSIKEAQQAEHLRVCQHGTPEEKAAWIKNNCGFASALKSAKKVTIKFGK